MLLIGTPCRLHSMADDDLDAVYEVRRRIGSKKEMHEVENKLAEKLHAKLRTRRQSACHPVH